MSRIPLHPVGCLCVLTLSLCLTTTTAATANECAILATEAGNDLADDDPTRYEHLKLACDNQRPKPSIAPRAKPSAPVARMQGKPSSRACRSGATPLDTPPASPGLDPFQIDYYSKLYTYKAPDCQRGVPPVKVGKIGIEVGLYYLEDWLKKLREARDGLLELCVGSHGDKQVVEYRGNRVAASPDWLRACNQRASLLASGEPQALVEALRKWNVIAGSNYVRPRAQDVVDAWTRKKSTFVHFGGTTCDDASHDIMIRAPLGQVTHKAVYERNKDRCGPEWGALFDSRK